MRRGAEPGTAVAATGELRSIGYNEKRVGLFARWLGLLPSADESFPTVQLLEMSGLTSFGVFSS